MDLDMAQYMNVQLNILNHILAAMGKGIKCTINEDNYKTNLFDCDKPPRIFINEEPLFKNSEESLPQDTSVPEKYNEEYKRQEKARTCDQRRLQIRLIKGE